MIHKITLLTAAVVLALVAGLTPRAFAQSYETQHASKIMLPSNGNDPTNTLTIVANALTHSTTLKFPDGFGAAAGSILTNDGSGVLSWTAPGLSTITPGTMGQFLITNSSTAVAWSNFLISTDFTGNGATTNLAIAQTSAAGADIIAALTANAGSITNNTSGNATTSTTASNVVTNTVSNNASYYPALLSSATGVASTPVDVGGSALSYNPSTGTLSSTNFSGALNNSGTSPTTNIDNSATGGTTNIGNGTSTTYINGALDITGTVTYTSTPSIPLASNDILIGNGLSPSEGVAAPMTQDVSLSYTGGNAQATVNGSHAATFAVTNAETVGGTLTSSGNVSLDASPSSGGTVVIGNSAGPSTTTINGALNITGAVTYTTVPSLPLPSADIFVGNGASPSIAAAVAMSGDATISNTGLLTIGNNKVTYGKMQAVTTTSRLLGSSATTTPVQEITLGSGLSITGSQLNTVNNGNVTSGTLVNNGAVYATGASAIASTTQMTAGQLLIGSGASSVPLLGTITTSGSGITATYTSPNIVLANTGVTSLSGGTTGLTDGTGTGAVTLTGTLISTNGGTGVSNPTAHDLLIAEGATAMTPISGAAGTVLVGNGSSTDPSFSAVPTLGVPGTTAGTLTLASGAAAFSTTVQTSATTPASTYIYQLPAQPTGLPTPGNVLTIGTPTGTGPYTVPLTWTVPNSTTGVLYNQTTEQATVPISSTPATPSFLFNVGYNNTVVADSAAGAVINSINTNTANTTNDGPLHNADGFTVNVTATGGTNGYGNATGLIVNATAPVGGIPTGLAVTIKGDSIGPEFLLHNNSGKGSRSIIETVDSELDLTQTGDLYGSSILRMQNRTGANGAIFQTVSNSTDTGTDLVDWGFIPGNDVQSNVRLEARHKWATVSPAYAQNEYLRSSANISAAIPEEFQYFFGTTGSAPRYVLDVGENATMLERGSFAIGYGDTVAGDTAVGSPRERLDVHSPGTFWGGNSDAGYKGASNIILSDSGTATGTAPYIGAMEFQGANDGLSSFKAGSQGSKYITYTWPTVSSIPSADQVLSISGTPSGSGTVASPWLAQLAWSTVSGSSGGVNYNVAENSGQASASSGNYLFDVGYAGNAGGGGARINSLATSGNSNDTGLSIYTQSHSSSSNTAVGLALSTSGSGTQLDIVGTSSTWSVTNGGVMNLGGGTNTGDLQVNSTTAGIGTTSTDGLVLVNPTTATSSHPQNSPRIRLTGQDYSSGSHTDSWLIENHPGNGAIADTLVFSDNLNGAASNSADAQLTSGGTMTLGPSSGEEGALALGNSTNTNFTTIEAGAPSAAITYILPTTAPTVGQVLQSSAPVSNVATLSWTANGGGGSGSAVFGDGSDGSATFNGSTSYNTFSSLASSVYTLSRDVFLTSATVSNGVTINPNGYRIYCTGTLTVNSGGAISVNGGNATTTNTGPGYTSTGPLGNGTTGGAAGTFSTHIGGTSTVPTAPADGGTGGTGGTTSSYSGGAAGTVAAIGSAYGGSSADHSFSVASTGIMTGIGTYNAALQGGSGGGGGAYVTSGTHSGGAGGGGAGVMVISASAISNSGSITANGGTGGAASATTAGAGAGGGGGVVLMIYSSFSGTTPTATGGAFGSTGITSTAAAAGTVVLIQN